jgi:hypothetical protein
MKPTLPSIHVRMACVLATIMVAVAFLTASVSGGMPLAGNLPLGANTWTEIGLILIGGGLGIWGLLRAGLPRRPHWGSISVGLFAALAVLTALSIVWSVAPDQSWLQAARTAAYLAIFAGAAVCARLLPGQWQSLASGIAIAAVALSTWALLVKIFNWPLYQQPNYGRLTAPFGYWNATGTAAAMGLPATVWASARRRRSVILRGLAVPAIAILITVVVLSYSRSALVAAVLGLAIPLLLSDLKLRSLSTLALGVAGAAIMSAWGLIGSNISADSGLGAPVLSHAARSSSDRDFGIVVVVVVVAFTAIGIAAARRFDAVQLTVAVRKRLHMLLAGLVALTPLVLLLALALSSRGIGGEVSHIWDSLTQEASGTTDAAARLTTLANSRPTYWHQALSVFDGHRLAGSGADTFNPAALRYTNALLLKPPAQAHSYVFQTLSDLGLIGGVLNLTLLLCWIGAAIRTFAYRGWPGQAGRAGRVPRLGLWGPEREGSLALLGVVVAFGFSGAIDWTWFFPGLAMPALAAAGWIAGRGPLNRVVHTAPGTARPRGPEPAVFTAVAVVAIVALLAAWYTWQPLRAQSAMNASGSALERGHGNAALVDALNATRYQPEALAPLENLSAVYQYRDQVRLARAALVRATVEQPNNPAAWRALGMFDLCKRDYSAAGAAIARAEPLDLTWNLAPAASAAQTRGQGLAALCRG